MARRFVNLLQRMLKCVPQDRPKITSVVDGLWNLNENKIGIALSLARDAHCICREPLFEQH